MYWYDILENDNELVDRDFFEKNFKLLNDIYTNEAIYTDSQEQTADTFGYKWSKKDTYSSDNFNKQIQSWLFEKYFNNSQENFNKYIGDGGNHTLNFLDAGCGAGVSAFNMLGTKINDMNYLGVDISKAALYAKEMFKSKSIKGEFLRTNLTELPFKKPVFDIIFSEGVLHHTDSTENSFKYLCQFLKDNGVMMIYIYSKKAPVREFTDDLIRDYLKNYTNEEAWELVMPLTKLGKALGDLNAEINIEDDIPYLGIKKGTHNIQRLFYYVICKAFYKSDWNLQEMNHVNFDWFRPVNCHRHTVDEVRAWCSDLNLHIEHIIEQPAGITFIARK